MKKLIHMDDSSLGELVCDNPTCDFVDSKQRFSAALIDKPCPKCGESLLTRQDYNKTISYMRAVDWINKWFGWLGSEDPPPLDKAYRMKVHIHNKIKIEVE